MELRLLKEQIHLEQPVGQGQSQAVVEGEITLPGGLREETRVLAAQAMAVIDGMEAMQDRSTVTGRVVFHTLFLQGAQEDIQTIEAAADFTHLMDLPGAAPRSQCRGWAQVEHVEARAHNGRLSLRAVVRLAARAVSAQPVEALTGLTGVDGLEVRTRPVTLKRTVASGSGEALLREEFELPASLQLRDTLYATASAQLQEVTGGLGRIGLSGQVEVEAVHAGAQPGKPLVKTRHTLPFEQSIDLIGESGETLEGDVQIKDVAVISQEAGEGERTLRAEVLLGLQGWSDRRETVTVLDDAYTTRGDDLTLTAQELHCRTEDRRYQAAESGKIMLALPESAPPVRSVAAVFASPVMTGREQAGNRTTVEGMLEITLLYMTDGSAAPVSVHLEEPVRASFALQAGEGDPCLLRLSDVEAAAVTSDRVEMKYILHLRSDGMEAQRIRLMTDAAAVPGQAPEEDIVLYFVQPGEALWDVARRYRVPMRDVRALNPELTDEVKPGQGVVVWNRGRNG